MIEKGRNCHRIFTDSGLIYEKISSSDDDVDAVADAVDSGGWEWAHEWAERPQKVDEAVRLGAADSGRPEIAQPQCRGVRLWRPS